MENIYLRKGNPDYNCCSYFDLIKQIEKFYADGEISDQELSSIRDIRGDTLINYQVSVDLLSKLDPKAPQYDKLKDLTEYLRRCWRLMDHAYEKSTLVNQEKSKQNPIPKKEKDKKIELNIGREEAILVTSLSSPTRRRMANTNHIVELVQKMPKDVREQATLRISRALEKLERTQINDAIKRMAALEQSRD